MLVCRDRLAAYQKQQLSYIVSRISEDNLLKKSSVARGTLTPLTQKSNIYIREFISPITAKV